MVNFGNQPDHMSAEQAEWLEFCKCAYDRHMRNQDWDDPANVKLLPNPAGIQEADLVCVAIGSGPSAEALTCMAFFSPSGEVVGFADCVHDVILEWPNLSNEPSVHPDLRAMLN